MLYGLPLPGGEGEAPYFGEAASFDLFYESGCLYGDLSADGRFPDYPFLSGNDCLFSGHSDPISDFLPEGFVAAFE